MPAPAVDDVRAETALQITRCHARGAAVLDPILVDVRTVSPVVPEVVDGNIQGRATGQRGKPLRLPDVEPGILNLRGIRSLQIGVRAITAAEGLVFVPDVRVGDELVRSVQLVIQLYRQVA